MARIVGRDVSAYVVSMTLHLPRGVARDQVFAHAVD